jgi:hypothetical protein
MNLRKNQTNLRKNQMNLKNPTVYMMCLNRGSLLIAKQTVADITNTTPAKSGIPKRGETVGSALDRLLKN